MKHKFALYYFSIFLLWTASCASLFAQLRSEVPVGDASGILTIDIAGALESKEVVDITDYFSSIEYVPLGEGQLWIPEATTCNIFYADKENYYLTFGSRKNRGCFKFTKDGKYVTSFIDKGTWTHEFYSVDDIAACKENGNIALCDDNKVVIFTSDGKWVTTLFVYHLLGESGCVKDIHFTGADKVRFLWYQESTGRVSAISMDLKGNVLHREFLAHGNEKRFPYSQISEFGGELKYFSQQCDTVYAVDENFRILGAKYFLDFGEYKKGKVLSGYKYKNIRMLVNRDIMETDNFIILEILFPAYSNEGIEQHRIIDKILYDKRNQKSLLLRYYNSLNLKAEGFNNNLDGGAPFLPSHMIGNRMYQFIDAAKFIDLAGKCRSAKMKEVASRLKPTSNPVMVVAKLK